MNLARITLVMAYVAYRNNIRKCHITHLSSSSNLMHRLLGKNINISYRTVSHVHRFKEWRGKRLYFLYTDEAFRA